ncbi:hypothetical protein SPRG_13044 [Saprolegnia parasitica CBS 223.65]|uniref:Uncharacterized protein n=1 Tax=Saprolegnia parasitica (strain CBS 223.65) TaxID=695850 RepID=A0A067C5A7_SAPPC|nr:hypothetical protein SPRG_13044 [Saprolegnia parasitica CBS 223.65]KDO21706.1 hypothetical protein SPRG_13044 [Saprolegnia parasitica CBS 223.65]|eukprot:XP_012207627.1 hypothetical protein SPRG_13044 [Saprolegnia parasitica CBS 223.65]
MDQRRILEAAPGDAHVCVHDPHLYDYLSTSQDAGYLRALCPAIDKAASKTDAIKIAFVPALYKLSMSWCYRATRFTHAVVALVTANAYISTLGGGYFLCRHLNQAKLMAQLQICVSQGLQDPILASKCRVNMAYGAMAQGQFKRAYKLLRDEGATAEALQSDDLRNVVHAANVYLRKTVALHKQLLRHEETDTTRVVDEYYRQRVVKR